VVKDYNCSEKSEEEKIMGTTTSGKQKQGKIKKARAARRAAQQVAQPGRPTLPILQNTGK